MTKSPVGASAPNTKTPVPPQPTKKTSPTTAAKSPVSKPAAAAKKPAATPVKAAAAPTGKPPKAKLKLVRDSFTMPQPDFELIDVLKQRAMNFRHAVKKSELLRAGLQVLATLPDVQLEKALARITPLKTGRPKKAG
ncbi:MAG: hypothetical protein K2X42_00115 [Burkholderiaceae bacterium]|nr:hypothetical protein [Burkholderiaceae bacterium]